MVRPEGIDDRGSDSVAQRASWPVKIVPLASRSTDDLSAVTTAAERLAMMWTLTLDAWSTMGEAIPHYPRSQAPVRVVRRDH